MAPHDPELDVAATVLVDHWVDFVVPDDPANDRRLLEALSSLGGRRLRDDALLAADHLMGRDHLRATTSAGIIDVLRGGLPPLDLETVRAGAIPGLDFDR